MALDQNLSQRVEPLAPVLLQAGGGRLIGQFQVESHGHALFGFFSFKNKRGRRAQDAADARTVVRVTGWATIGFAEGR